MTQLPLESQIESEGSLWDQAFPRSFRIFDPDFDGRSGTLAISANARPATEQCQSSLEVGILEVASGDVPTKSNIIHGFSPSKISSSNRLPAPAVDRSPIAGYTIRSEAHVQEKEVRPLTLKRSHWSNQSSPGGSLDTAINGRFHRCSSKCLVQSCPRNKPSPDVANDQMEFSQRKEGTDTKNTATEFVDDLDPLVNDGYSSEWEETVSKSGASSFDTKPLFPWSSLSPGIVSRPSLLTAMIHEAYPLVAQPAIEIRAGQSRPSPIVQRLIPHTNSPFWTLSKNGYYGNKSIDGGINIPFSKLGTHTASCSVSAPPKPRPETTLVDEVSESLRWHLQWETSRQYRSKPTK